jgi:hypothetical protein
MTAEPTDGFSQMTAERSEREEVTATFSGQVTINDNIHSTMTLQPMTLCALRL